MNIIAVDIGNTNISMGLFIDGVERRIETAPGDNTELITEVITAQWEEIPMLESAREPTRNGVIVISSVKPEWTESIRTLAAEKLSSKIMLIGQDIPLPIEVAVDEPAKVGTDRVVAAAAAYAVVEQAVVIADFGSAITIDLVDENGVFQGGIIAPGLKLGARALHEYTAKLPLVKPKRPEGPWGSNTESAIQCGLHFGAVGLLNEVVRRYAEKLGTWPFTVVTGGDGALIHEDCDFVDRFVPYLTIKGIALTFTQYLEGKDKE